MRYSNRTQLMYLTYRERKLLINPVANMNLLRKIRRKIAALKSVD